MSVVNEQIRELADRVAASHGLDVVDLEFVGGSGKHRTLRVFLERNAEGRAALAKRLQELQSAGADEASEETVSVPDDGVVALDLSAADELLRDEDEDEEELAYLQNLPSGVPMAQLSGITHGDCARFSQDFGTALDVEELIPGAEYVLEASSPGLDRRLSKPEDYTRFAGQLLKLQTFTAVDGQKRFEGRIGPVAEDVLTLLPLEGKALKKKKGLAAEPKPVEIALANVEKAQLVPEF